MCFSVSSRRSMSFTSARPPWGLRSVVQARPTRQRRTVRSPGPSLLTDFARYLGFFGDSTGLAFDGVDGFWGTFEAPVSAEDPWSLYLRHLAP